MPGRGSCVGYAVLLAATFLHAAPAHAQAGAPKGVWLLDGRAAVDVFDCAGLMCGKIAWLIEAHDAQGFPDRDINNPDKTLRRRPLCGIMILSNLHPDGRNRWKDGRFYNPNDGKNYRVSASIRSSDVMVARIYVGAPMFGKTKILTRVPREQSKGWCP